MVESVWSPWPSGWKNNSGSAEPSAEIKNKTPAINSPFFLPNFLPTSPARAPPTIHPMSAMETSHPFKELAANSSNPLGSIKKASREPTVHRGCARPALRLPIVCRTNWKTWCNCWRANLESAQSIWKQFWWLGSPYSRKLEFTPDWPNQRANLR